MPLFYEFRDDDVHSKPATITGAYLDNFKAIWDLYITDSATTGADLLAATGDASEAEFGNGEAVFYQNGSWEYSALTEKYGMKAEDLQMIPIYCGVKGEEEAGLCSGTENCWAVNAEASEADIQATLDFMKWVVTSEEGTTMLAEQFGPCPFNAAKTPENVFFADANALTTEVSTLSPGHSTTLPQSMTGAQPLLTLSVSTPPAPAIGTLSSKPSLTAGQLSTAAEHA